jgi:hypothetical protein
LQAHSVRGESCNADSSPEPSAACSEVGGCPGLWGEGLSGAAGGSRYAQVSCRSSLWDGVWWLFHRGSRCGNVTMEFRGGMFVPAVMPFRVFAGDRCWLIHRGGWHFEIDSSTL